MPEVEQIFCKQGHLQRRDRRGARYCRICNSTRKRGYYRNNIEESRKKHARYARERHQRNRRQVIEVYGGKCACCEETEIAFLTVDHVEEGGNEHRRSLSSTGKMVGSSNFYAWLVRNNFPDGFQILCHNCNFAKSHTPGGCPHGRP